MEHLLSLIVAETKVFRTIPDRPDFRLFRWSEVSHNLSGKLCPIYLGLDKIRDVRIGYARVSTDDQTLDLQKDALKRAKYCELYEEQAGGNTSVGRNLKAASRACVRAAPSLFGGLDRLGRNLADLVRHIADLARAKKWDLPSDLEP
jgi:Resolvase, N terminal domain